MKKILYVDDAHSLRQLVDMVLSKHYELSLAENGAVGLDIAKQSHFDLIISDINMPVMNGFELLEALRKQDEYKFTPILMLTTEASAEMKEQGKQCGATGWLIKPFDPEKLLKVIERVLG
ncbi:MAG: response regulator [Thiomicrospira sp.]|uniref:response regulator n=1 Tax=Thiomicrospira sp. TaxID=935 RepID=UPI0019E0FA85|nr:response regulator [Thiomicrospira sp.]MBE0494274.1 response regulator [Thiomicrospira sp.]